VALVLDLVLVSALSDTVLVLVLLLSAIILSWSCDTGVGLDLVRHGLGLGLLALALVLVLSSMLLVLVFRLRSWSWSCQSLSWSWPDKFGLVPITDILSQYVFKETDCSSYNPVVLQMYTVQMALSLASHANTKYKERCCWSIWTDFRIQCIYQCNIFKGTASTQICSQYPIFLEP